MEMWGFVVPLSFLKGTISYTLFVLIFRIWYLHQRSTNMSFCRDWRCMTLWEVFVWTWWECGMSILVLYLWLQSSWYTLCSCLWICWHHKGWKACCLDWTCDKVRLPDKMKTMAYPMFRLDWESNLHEGMWTIWLQKAAWRAHSRWLPPGCGLSHLS